MKYLRITLRLVASLILLLTCTGATAAAATAAKSTPTTSSSSTATPTTVDTGAQGYAADSPIQDGTIVQLKAAGSSTVAISTKADLGHMYGVTVNKNNLSVSVANSALKNEVYVATSGTYNVLVSSQGGDINSGDYVTLSSINGVAMKAGLDNTTVFGRAASNFTSKSSSLGKLTLKDTTGKTTQTVSIAMIPVAISVQSNPEQKSTKSNLPKPLQRLGQAIAEKPVGPLRIYLSIGIIGISIISAIVILYSGVRNSLISIGRNPLSKKSIFRGLLEIILTSLLILIIGMFAVYLLLKL